MEPQQQQPPARSRLAASLRAAPSDSHLVSAKGLSQARQLVERGQAQTAIHAVSRTLHNTKLRGHHDENMLLEHAKLLMGVGKHEQALDSLEAVLKSAPRHVQAWDLKATCYESVRWSWVGSRHCCW